jgi:hypothetical protein
MTDATQASGGSVRLDLSPSEAELLTTALKLLESTLGREEADELEEVQALLARLRSASAA